MKPYIITAIVLSVVGIYPAIVEPVVRYFGDVSIFPYQKGSTLNFDYSYTSTKMEKVTFTFDFSNTHYSNSIFYAHIVVLSSDAFTDTVSVPSAFLNEDAGIIKMKAVGDGFTTEKSFTVTAIEKATINPLVDTVNDVYLCAGKPLTINATGGLKYYQESLTFIGFKGLYESFAYHRLNFGNLIIHYDCGYNLSLLTYSSAHFYLKDPDNLFPNLAHDSNFNYKHLTGQLTTLGNGDYSFSISDKLYVDPITLMMSMSSNVGYVETNFLYFPKNHFSQLQEIDYRVVISNIGINEMNIDYSSSHYADNRFFGDCVNSAYCVTVEDQPIDVGYEVSWEEKTNG